MRQTGHDELDLDALAASWQIELEAQNKSDATITIYLTGLRAYASWLAANDRPATVTKNAVAAWLGSLHKAGNQSSTVRLRYRAMRRFSDWCVTEAILSSDPLATMKPPKLDSKIVPKISDEELTALIAACDGKTFTDRRDEAVVRMMAETLARAEEIVSLQLDDVDVIRGMATITRGKGGKARIVTFGAVTRRSLDRYLRMRRRHPCADRPDLWLAYGRKNGGEWGYAGLYGMLRSRAEIAGIKGFHPHRLRHTGASRWLHAGGSEGGLMAVAGWSDRSMLDRYVSDTAAERAAAEAARLGLGDI